MAANDTFLLRFAGSLAALLILLCLFHGAPAAAPDAPIQTASTVGD